jgi:hypothetical protein
LEARPTDAYQRPIFLHAINKELHDALDRTVDLDQLLASIRLFSVVSSQTMFCNISQVYELLFDKPKILDELIELEKIGRFVAPSDCSSFEEFRESRISNFSQTISRHPGFTAEPSKTLLKLPFGSLGQDFSTTKFIERTFGDWLDNRAEGKLNANLSGGDRRTLRMQEEWIGKTLVGRDQWALTFDAFESTAPRNFGATDEHAIRRALTQIYIDGYKETYSASTLWGLKGINHFEGQELHCGLNYSFAAFVLDQTGVDAFLRRKKEYGRIHRSLFESRAELAYFREGFLSLAAALDERLANVSLWHERSSKLRAVSQRLAASGLLANNDSYSSFNDLLLHSGERLLAAGRAALDGPSLLKGARDVGTDSEVVRRALVPFKPSPDAKSPVVYFHTRVRPIGVGDEGQTVTPLKKPSVFLTFGFASLIGGVVVAAASYAGL